ncbi:hypothetical protein [Erythrobacter sp. SG61-1L]|uniref:hypothetical protein n=1 Tax=Erythrobacter sp. SG61-1L TaxID=1603897 RepID=UPI0012E1722B|nr:hypothetical protein [Erythrobacter sp. SG61-1L]
MAASELSGADPISGKAAAMGRPQGKDELYQYRRCEAPFYLAAQEPGEQPCHGIESVFAGNAFDPRIAATGRRYGRLI